MGKEEQEKLEEIKKKVIRKYTSLEFPNLKISRVPEKLKSYLIDYANENCCGDYGWALSVLLGPQIEKNNVLLERLKKLENRLEQLEKEVRKE